MDELRRKPGTLPTISPRWLAAATGIALLAALSCAWLTLCLLYWQGSWQLLYHPKTAIERTPASLGIPFEQVKFAVTETGKTQLTGWWIPGSSEARTVLLLHGADGNLSDMLDRIASFHGQQLSVFAVDYRSYGQSAPGKPSEKQLRQDAEWALAWLTITRNIPAQKIVIYGTGLGANLGASLAAEPATDHSAVGGVVLEEPIENAMAPVFSDARSRLVPAHWLVRDRYDLLAAASQLQIPSLWLFSESALRQRRLAPDGAFEATRSQKSSAWLAPPITADPHFAETLRRWLDDLP